MVFCVLLGLIIPCTSTEHLYRMRDRPFERIPCGQFTVASPPTPSYWFYAHGLILRRIRSHDRSFAWGFRLASSDAPLDSSHLMSVTTPIIPDTVPSQIHYPLHHTIIFCIGICTDTLSETYKVSTSVSINLHYKIVYLWPQYHALYNWNVTGCRYRASLDSIPREASLYDDLGADTLYQAS